MMKTYFTYSKSIGEFCNAVDSTDLPHYMRFQILDKETGEILDEIITNASGCGRWVYDESTGQYAQRRGTCQYAIPRTPAGIRKALRADLKASLTEKMELGYTLTAREAEIFDFLTNG